MLRAREARTFAAILLLHAILDCYGGIWPIFKHLAGIPLGYAGFVATLTTSVMWSLQPLFGHWADQGRMRRCIVLGTALTFPMMFLGPLGDHVKTLGPAAAFALMIAVMALARLGQAMFHPAGATIAGNLATGRRSTFLSVFIAAGWAGYGASQIVYSSTYFAANGHTELALLPGLVLFTWAALACRPGETPAEIRTPVSWRLAFGALGDKGLLLLFIILTLMSAMNQGLLFLLPEFLAERGYPQWIVNGGGLAFLVVGSAIAMVPFGYLADRFNPRAVFAATVALSGATYGTLTLAPRLSLPMFILVCIATGGAISAVNPLGVALGQLLAPGRSSAVGGIMMGLAWGVAGVSQWIVGYLAGRPGSGPAESLIWLGAAALLAFALTTALPRPAPAPAVTAPVRA
jgi:FSR family fosmidomycin resistance protein-like MFS transporter